MPALIILIVIDIFICMMTLFRYYQKRILFREPFHRVVILLHFCFLIHLVYVLISKLYFPEGGWVENSAPFGLIYGPFLYYFTYTYKRGGWPYKTALLHFLPYVIFLLIQIALLVRSVDIHSSEAEYFMRVLYFLIPVSFVCYSLWAGWILIQGHLVFRFIFYLIVFIAVMGMIIVGFGMFESVLNGSDVLMVPVENDTNGFVIYVFFLALLLIFNRYGFQWKLNPGSELTLTDAPSEDLSGDTELSDLTPQDQTIRYEKSGLSQSDLERYEVQLDDYMRAHEPFLDSNLNLNSLAEVLKVPPHHLTQLLNVRKGQSFNHYINEMRVEHACSMLDDPKNENAFEEIGYSSGFNSKATFYRWFKRIKSKTPSQYREMRQ